MSTKVKGFVELMLPEGCDLSRFDLMDDPYLLWKPKHCEVRRIHTCIEGYKTKKNTRTKQITFFRMLA